MNLMKNCLDNGGRHKPEMKRILENDEKRKLAIQFVLLFGVISALGDIVYEGARSVYGTYLGYLGASALAIGLITGLGEFLGYALRLVFGFFVSKTKRYWTVAIVGYGLLISVPLLALAGKWQLAAVFILLERIVKAIRSPGKDAMLSYASDKLGRGFGFGLHEALDQLGAFIGPLLFTAVMAATGSYKVGFSIMWIPAIMTTMMVLYTRSKVPDPEAFESSKPVNTTYGSDNDSLSKAYWYYAAFTFISLVGFVNFPILSYHFAKNKILGEALIPALYAVAMALDGIFAVIIGKIYDKKGLKVLVLIPFLTILIALFGFLESSALSICSIMLWGIVMSLHETITKAAVADITGKSQRGKAYGIFHTLYGLAFFASGSIVGYVYERSAMFAIVFVVLAEVVALVMYMFLRHNIASSEL